jgi:uncharacterized Zn-binding protein involved in type VI secretion
MARGAHRHGDARSCGATTVVTNQSTVFVNDQLWAVKDTINSHGEGKLINTTGDTVFIEDKPVIVHGPDHAQPDNAGHPDPMTAAESGDVFSYA